MSNSSTPSPDAANTLELQAGAYIRRYLAERLGVQVGQIRSWKFLASESYAYSEYTYEDFDCDISILLSDGERKTVFLNESETVQFLNGFPEAVSP